MPRQAAYFFSTIMCPWIAVEAGSFSIAKRRWSRSASGCRSLRGSVATGFAVATLITRIGVELHLLVQRRRPLKGEDFIATNGQDFGAPGRLAVQHVVTEVIEVVGQGPLVEKALLRSGTGLGRVLGSLLPDQL
jgi:hypothetical protein